MPIKILTPDMVSKIAAGEVIERPASVVKELIENSLDAKASQISVEIQGGGVRSIKVVDNGLGIPSTEAELAFCRYATSKIADLTDLENISSLGFRGEALPSIAAVAEIEFSTKSSLEDVGSCLHLQGNEPLRQEAISRPSGTTVIVRRLFRYFPARLKFLKSTNTENSHIAHIIGQYAMAFPEVKFSLLLDKRTSLQTVGDGDLRGVVSQIYGFKIAQEMLILPRSGVDIKIDGLISPPSLTRSDYNYHSFFINKRWVRSPLLVKAVDQAYHGLLMVGRHPLVVMRLSLQPDGIDVNIHPTKAQVKFHDEQNIFTSVKKTVEEVLRNTSIARTNIQFPSAGSWSQQRSLSVRESEPVFEGFSSIDNANPAVLPALRVLGQVANTYVIAEGPDGLYIIDQHAAHERVRFDKILEQWAKQKVEVQGLLQPITIELNPKEEEIWRGNEEILSRFGFYVESFGDRNYLLRAMPVLIANENIRDVLTDLFDTLSRRDDSMPWEEKIAQSLSCHGAIRAGQQLSNEEMRELISQLEQSKQPRSCPHGRPTVIHMSLLQFEKEFGRRA